MSENTLELTADEIASLKRITDREAVLDQMWRFAVNDMERRLAEMRSDGAAWWKATLAARGLVGDFSTDLTAARPMLTPVTKPEQAQ